MMIRKRIKAERLKDIVKLPDEISDDTMLELVITKAAPREKDPGGDDHRLTAGDLCDLFHSRLRVASTEEKLLEEVFSLSDVSWQDINEMKTILEDEGYGVRIDQQGNSVRIKVLRRYA